MLSEQPDWLTRTLEVYSNKNEELVAEHSLSNVPLATLQQLWQLPSTEPMVDVFQVREEQRMALEQLTGVTLNLIANSYFVAAHTTDWDATVRDGGFMGLFPRPRDVEAFPNARPVRPMSTR